MTTAKLNAFKEGWIACLEGVPLDKNPYENCSESVRKNWIDGWLNCFEKWKNRK